MGAGDLHRSAEALFGCGRTSRIAMALWFFVNGSLRPIVDWLKTGSTHLDGDVPHRDCRG